MPKARRKAVADTPGRATESFRYTSNGEPAAAESEAAAAPELDYDEAAKVSVATPGVKRKRGAGGGGHAAAAKPAAAAKQRHPQRRAEKQQHQEQQEAPAPPPLQKQQRQQQQHVVPPAAAEAEAEAAPAAEAAAAKAQGKGKGKGKAAVRTKTGHKGESDTHRAAAPPPPYPEVPYVPSKQVDSLAQLAADILANEERGLAERCPQGSAGKEIRAALRVIKGASDITRDRLIEVAKSVQGLVPVDMDVDEQRTRLQEVRKLIGLYQEEERQLDAEEALLERRMAHPPPQPPAQDEGEDRNLQVMLQSLSGEDLEQQLHQVLEDIGQEAADICSNLASIRDTCEEAHDTQRQLYAHFEQWRYPNQGNARDAIRGMTQ